MPIEDPTTVGFVNDQVRPWCDRGIGRNAAEQSLLANWDLVSQDPEWVAADPSEVIVDGSENDARNVLTKNDVTLMMQTVTQSFEVVDGGDQTPLAPVIGAFATVNKGASNPRF